MIFVDGELWGKPVIEGWKMGFRLDNCSFWFVGSTHTFNKESGEYDIPWVDMTLKEIRERVTVAKTIKMKI